MKERIMFFAVAVLVVTGLVTIFERSSQAVAADAASRTAAQPAVSERPMLAALPTGFYGGDEGLNPVERAGREIWYKATAGNSRFHTYVFQQRVNVLIDWYRVLNAKERGDRFAAWGIINDPDCCIPGATGCPATSLEQTYGFEYCPGDDVLLSFVGKTGYRDPACDFADAPPDAGATDQRQTSCDLAFGTSTGALGYRKFPNPRFDKARWLAVNGSLASWDGFRGPLSKDPHSSDASLNRLADGSIEPPFMIGTSCGSCHISFDPLNPPKDPANPQWQNLKGAQGNQYSRVSEVLTSGMSGTTIEAQVFAHARPGVSDTSAIANDQLYNPGTMNAIINTDVRPTFKNEEVTKWRQAATCPANDPACWCDPEHAGKCWQRSTAKETVHHILKGGEDSIGALEAIQRVYINIGSCAEQCWSNHFTDLRQLDPTGRNYGETAFDIGQCRRDCPNFRAIEDRLPPILAFLSSHEADATDLARARENLRRVSTPAAAYSEADLERDLDKQFAPGSVARGREVFAANCARCHSSIPEAVGGAFAARDFRAPKGGGVNGRPMRADWMGNDQATFASEVGTNRCRSLHSNHMTGQVYAEYASETLHARPEDPTIREPHDEGRGYYRNISLLSLWAHAPFMHNNAIGPELCGKPANATNDYYRSPYVGANKETLTAAEAPACWAYDPSVDGRFNLFVASAQDLLNPTARVRKIARFDQDVALSFGPRMLDGGEEKQVLGFTLVIPAGVGVGAMASFQHKALVRDMVLAKVRPAELDTQLQQALGAEGGKAIAADVRALTAEIVKDPANAIEAIRHYPKLVAHYSSCTADVENDGHRFGEDLPDTDKKALIAFLATL